MSCTLNACGDCSAKPVFWDEYLVAQFLTQAITYHYVIYYILTPQDQSNHLYISNGIMYKAKSGIFKVINSSLWGYICVNLTNIWHVLFIMCINSVSIHTNHIDILHDYSSLSWPFRFSMWCTDCLAAGHPRAHSFLVFPSTFPNITDFSTELHILCPVWSFEYGRLCPE